MRTNLEGDAAVRVVGRQTSDRAVVAAGPEEHADNELLESPLVVYGPWG